MFSDKSSRNITLIVFFIFYLYLDYQKSKLIIQKSPTNLKCDPIQMMIGSVFEGEESANNTYKNCMQYSMNDALVKKEIEMNQQSEDFGEKMKEYIEDKTTDYNEDQDKAVKLINENINNSSDLIKQQNIISEQIEKAGPKINDIFTKIGNISKKLPDIFNNINSNLSLSN